MCRRFAMNAQTDELVREFVADGGKPEDWWKSWPGSYSIAPTDSGPIVRDRGEGRLLELVRWDWQKPANRPKGVKLECGDRDGIQSVHNATSTEMASKIRQYVVDRKVNNSRTVVTSDPTIIQPAA